MASSQGSGSNMQIHMISDELMDKMKANGKVIAIWPDCLAPAEKYEENDKYLQRAYDLGVKMITTDHP